MGLVWQSLRDWLDNQSTEMEEPVVISEPSMLEEENSTTSGAIPTSGAQPAL
jgi:hypothetical protein